MYKFTGESKLDVCVDLADAFFEILTDPEIQELQKAGKPVSAYVKPAIKNHRDKAVEMLARVQTEDGVSPDEYLEKVGVLTIPVEFLQLLTAPEFNALFNSQGQSSGKTSGGSVTANTEVKGK